MALAGYALAGSVGVPLLVKWQLAKQLPALTQRQVTVQAVRCNPFALSLTIRGLDLREPDGAPFASLGEFHVNVQLWASLFRWAIALDEIRLIRPAGAIVRRADGRFNFANLASNDAPKPKTERSGGLPRLYIRSFRIQSGAATFTDQMRPVPATFAAGPVDIELTGLNTLPGRDGRYEIVATTPHRTKFWWRGTLSLNPVRSEGEFKLANLHLPPYATYLEDVADVRLTHGRVDLGARYRLDASTAQPLVELNGGAFDLTMLDLEAPDGTQLLELRHLAVRGIEANLASQQVNVASVTLTGGYAFVERQANGQLNWLALLKPPPAKPNTAPAPAAVAPAPGAPVWRASVGDVRLADWSLKFSDRQLKQPANILADQIALSVGEIVYPALPVLPVAVSLRLNGTGTVKLAGQVAPLKPAATVDVKVDGLLLPPFQPYVGENVELAIREGALSLEGKLNLDGASLTYAGAVHLQKLRTVDTISFQDFVKLDELSVTGIEAHSAPLKLAVGEVKLVGLDTALIILSNGVSNLQAMLAKPASSNAGPVAVTNPPAQPLPLQVETVTLENAALRFIDQTVQPTVRTGIDNLQCQVSGFSTMTSTPARVELAGKLDGRALFGVTGQLKPRPDDLLVDLTIHLGEGELTGLSPYAAKFAGYPIAKGRLSLDLKYAVADKALQAQNKVRIDQFRFGPKSNSPDATKLPVKLAVALLQDRHGVIALDVPLSGRTDDPKFRLMPLVLQVFLNVITKAVTKPFNLLGALVGTDQDLGFVSFLPGTAEFAPGETNKLGALTRALVERPGLDLEIAGDVDVVADREALARQKLQDKLKLRRIAELPPRERPATAAEYLLAEADYQRLVQWSFAETFTNQPAVVASAPLTGAVPALVKEPGRNFTAGRRVEPKPGQVQAPGAVGPLTFAEMERQLLVRIPVSADDYRQLMRARAAKSRDRLGLTGEVAAERLFLLEPAPPNADHTGQSRASFTVQ